MASVNIDKQLHEAKMSAKTDALLMKKALVSGQLIRNANSRRNQINFYFYSYSNLGSSRPVGRHQTRVGHVEQIEQHCENKQSRRSNVTLT